MYLLTESAEASAGMGWGLMIFYILIIGVAMYFMAIRPQKKEQKRINAMLAELAVGDCVVTTGGFYGIVIDITDEDVIVEFGSNKNCRIPMKKTAIAEVEKAEA
ncbi:MAG: preprotein translocase subunit YajC [Candidatus Limivivens sp.]|nr:preprotein translocase subunit YajC [Candidatus Limivivens sp.]